MANVPAEGDIIAGRYRLFERLGAGGMATVYLASMEGPGGFGKQVAIKRIHPHLAHTERFVEMFLDEARIVSRIDHPNVCSVLDFGQTDDTYFLAMEYIMGETLLSVLRKLKANPGLVASPRWQAFTAFVIAEACEGLHAAHELKDEFGNPVNIVHRDVSPDNIFVSYKGAVKIMDFGIARAEGRLHKTVTGTVKGKFGYMPPEVLNATPDLDRRVDVWALGVCLWEMLAGKRLFKRPSEAATIAAIMLEPLPPPTALVANIPPVLEEITMAALSRERDERIDTARDLGRRLRRFIAESDVVMDAVEAGELVRSIHTESMAEKEEQRSRILQIQAANSTEARLSQQRPAMTGGRRAVTAGASQATGAVTKTSTGSGRPAFAPNMDAIPTMDDVAAPDIPPAMSVVALDPAGAAQSVWWRRIAIGLAAILLVGGGALGWSLLSGSSESDDARQRLAQGEARMRSNMAEDPGSSAATRPDENKGAGEADSGEPAGTSKDSEEPTTVDEGTGDDQTADKGGERARSRRSSSRSRRRTKDKKGEGGSATAGTSAEGTKDGDGTSTGDPVQTPPEDPPEDKVEIEGMSKVAIEPPKMVAPPPVEVPVDRPEKPTSFKASVSIGSLSSRGSLSRSHVSRAVDRQKDAFAKCYRSAAEKAGKNPGGTMQVSLKLDEAGRARKVTSKKAPLPGLSGCVEKAAKKIRSRQAPDVGQVPVSFDLKFKPAR